MMSEASGGKDLAFDARSGSGGRAYTLDAALFDLALLNSNKVVLIVKTEIHYKTGDFW